jgi:hypothetical protein
MLIHREGWLYSGRTPAFFSGQSGCYCCGVGVGSLVFFYGANASSVAQRDVDSYVVDSWTSKTDGPTPARTFLGSGTVDGIAYVFGGASSTAFLTDNESYVLSTDTFTSKAAMTSSRWAMATFFNATHVYSVTGYDNTATQTRTVYQYSPSGNSWATKTDTPTPARVEAAGFMLAKGYCVGGGGGGTPLGDTDQYDTSADSWTSKTNINASRLAHGGFALDGYGYILLGDKLFGTFADDAEKYDETANTWTTGSTISGRDKRRNAGAQSPGSTGSGFIAGGQKPLGAGNTLQNDEYNGATWTTRTDMPTPARFRHTCAESV